MSKQVGQGFDPQAQDRMPMPELASLTADQRRVAEDLIAGPRKGIKGPFIPLLRSPNLLERLGKVGESLRFEGVLSKRISEFTMLVVARHVGNQFEWFTHHPLAIGEGVSSAALEQLRQGARPDCLQADEALAYDLALEVLGRHGLSDGSYAKATAAWGERGVVEFTALIGYFLTVCLVMNVARTPVTTESASEPLSAFPQ